MKRKIYVAIIILMLGVISCTDLMYLGLNSIGEKLYPIYTEADLLAIDDTSELLSRSYILMNDIALTVSFAPIGTNSSPFAGKFYGQGFTISNLSITVSVANTGFFSKLSGAIVKDLNIEGIVTSSGNFNSIGVLSGSAENSSIRNCTVAGTLDSTHNSAQNIGGLVGSMYNTVIFNSHSSVDVTAKDITGGLVGTAVSSMISFSSASGEITGVNRTGGLIGLFTNGTTLSSCYYQNSDAEKVTGAQSSGGLVGKVLLNESGVSITIKNSYVKSNGSVESTTLTGNTGGLIGSISVNNGINSSKLNITNCFAAVSVINISGENGGGLIGRIDVGDGANNTLKISSSVATGNVTSDVGGGFVGYINTSTSGAGNSIEIEYSYSTGDVSGSNSGGFFGNNDGDGFSCLFCYAAPGNVSGGVIGGFGSSANDSATFVSCFYNSQSGPSEDIRTGIEGRVQPLTAVNMKFVSSYTNLDPGPDWNFSSVWTIDSSGFINDGYPYLRSNPPR